jgi:hypothetical protein
LGAWLRNEPVAAAAQPTEYESEGLVVSAADLDLGEVWEVTEFVQDLPIHNRSRSERKIEDFAASCLCTAVEPRVVVIPPGGTAVVHVHIDPNHRSPDEAMRAVRPFAVEITPIQNTSLPHPPGWRIHGQFKSRVTLGVLTVHFGQEVVQGEPAPTRIVAAAVHVPMQKLEARIEPAAIGTATAAPDPAQPDRMEIRITPADTLPTGPFKAALIVDVIDPSGQSLPGARLPIAGTVQPEARLLPARIILGAHAVGTTAETVVILQAPAEAPWAVDHIETDSADVSVEATTAEGIPTGRAFRVTQWATREGNQSDTVRFVVRKAGGAPLTLAMEVMCHGEVPKGATTPESAGRLP